MIESVILFVVFVFVISLLSIPFIWGFLNKSNPFNRLDFTKIALYLSLIVLTGFGFAFIFKMILGSELDWPRFILLSISPIATISGFYMVYQTFNVQTNNSKKQEIHELIKLQNRILDEIVLVEKDIDPSNISSQSKKYSGRAAFKKIIEDFNNSYESFQRLWNAFILLSIKVSSPRYSSLETEATKMLNQIFNIVEYNKNETERFITTNYNLFTEKVVQNEFLKNLNYRELLASSLYTRLYYDGKTGDQYFKQNFDFDSLSIKTYITEFYKFSDDVDFFNYDDNFNIYTSPFSGETFNHIFVNNKIKSTNFSKWLKDFYPEDLLTKTKENSQDLQLYLDTYFRNLFNAYKTVAKIENIDIRADSSRLLRTQISSYEQAVIFLNSLTPMGKEWQKDGGLNLFRDFHVIKNISENVIQHIQPWEVYPEEDGFQYEFLNNKKNS